MPSRLLPCLVVLLPLAWMSRAGAQPPPRTPSEDWTFDPAPLVADGQSLLRHAPDHALDGLFLALHASAQQPGDAQALCTLFDPRADRSLAGLHAVAARLGASSRQRLSTALIELLLAASQAPPQPFDEAQARQALKAAGVRAALLNDGFTAGLSGADAGARCDSLRMLLDALQPQPRFERAAVTRLLLIDGLALLAPGVGEAGLQR